MKNSRMLIIAAIATCGLAIASTGISQTRTRTTTTKTQSKSIPTESKATTKKLTPENKLQKESIEATKTKCIDELSKAFGFFRYSEKDCFVEAKGTKFYLGQVDFAYASGGGLTITCRDKNANCVYGFRNQNNKGYSNAFTNRDFDSSRSSAGEGGLLRCLEYLKDRCKK